MNKKSIFAIATFIFIFLNSSINRNYLNVGLYVHVISLLAFYFVALFCIPKEFFRDLRIGRLPIFMFLLATTILFSSWVNANPTAGLKIFLKIMSFASVLICLVLARIDFAFVRKMAYALAIVNILPIVLSFVPGLSSFSQFLFRETSWIPGRFETVFNDVGYLWKSGFLAAIFAGQRILTSKITKIDLLMVFIGLELVSLDGGRTGLLVTLTGIAIFAAFQIKKSKALNTGVLAAIGISVFILIPLAAMGRVPFIDQFTKTGHALNGYIDDRRLDELPDGEDIRLVMYNRGIMGLKNLNALGHGPGASNIGTRYNGVQVMHNSFLQIAIDFGVIAFIAFLAVFFGPAINYFYTVRRSNHSFELLALVSVMLAWTWQLMFQNFSTSFSEWVFLVLCGAPVALHENSFLLRLQGRRKDVAITKPLSTEDAY